MPDLTLITPTGDRPEAFALCERWMAAQRYDGSVEWIVVDDGDTPARCTMGQRLVRRERKPGEPAHTLPLNLLAAMEAGINGDAALFIEDDDYYAPDYLSFYARLLKEHQLVGEGLARYYHLPARRWWRHKNRQHASLAQTGMKRSMLPILEGICRNNPRDPFIDLKLWGHGGHIITDDADHLRLHCSIKAMPGRQNTICVGHDGNRKNYTPDPDERKLKNWVGPDAAIRYMLIGGLPRGDAILRRLPHGPAEGVEVGVADGLLSAYLMRRKHDLSLRMVDPWRMDAYLDQADTMAMRTPAAFSEDRKTAERLTSFASTRRHVDRSTSLESAAGVADGSQDFVFIDADHSRDAVTADIEAWGPKVRPGGWIGGHDYCNTDAPHTAGVTDAVDEAAGRFGWSVETDEQHTWFARIPAQEGVAA